MYVTDLLSVIINVDEICTSSIVISLNTHSHPACGDVSYNVTISDNVIYIKTLIICMMVALTTTLLINFIVIHCTTLQ